MILPFLPGIFKSICVATRFVWTITNLFLNTDIMSQKAKEHMISQFRIESSATALQALLKVLKFGSHLLSCLLSTGFLYEFSSCPDKQPNSYACLDHSFNPIPTWVHLFCNLFDVCLRIFHRSSANPEQKKNSNWGSCRDESFFRYVLTTATPGVLNTCPFGNWYSIEVWPIWITISSQHGICVCSRNKRWRDSFRDSYRDSCWNSSPDFITDTFSSFSRDLYRSSSWDSSSSGIVSEIFLLGFAPKILPRVLSCFLQRFLQNFFQGILQRFLPKFPEGFLERFLPRLLPGFFQEVLLGFLHEFNQILFFRESFRNYFWYSSRHST